MSIRLLVWAREAITTGKVMNIEVLLEGYRHSDRKVAHDALNSVIIASVDIAENMMLLTAFYREFFGGL
jgi:hypothetical protein